MLQNTIERNKGFSLLELMVAIAILLTVSGAALYGLAFFQTNYSSTSLRQNLHASMRSATELLEQEVGQAGLLTGLPGVSTITITAPATVSASAAPQIVTLSSTTNMFVGEKLLVDLDANQESVAITAIAGSTITGVFTNPHSSGALVSLVGVFPQGVMTTSTATQLQLIGDINSDGNLYYVVYNCNPSATAPYGTLTRSITQLPAIAASAADTLVQSVIPNPSGAACFTYGPTNSVTVNGTTYQFITSVGITVTTQSSQPDPQTKQYVSMTKSFLNVTPRNVLYGYNLATAKLTGRLQPLPPQGTYRP
ncbi:MAG TPA: prepilin-type N-terminal cleavage/methylation domain-containing protein [Candidatus Sulfotelmatobacter sp.]|jgi:prepilin-type N-terminal cleavage/methylation domain-containing protein|nr:prepilin-type N-terminal cleavage/methylation domain-containing protein [Candidatus Sulfotelmatobacter sp.]